MNTQKAMALILGLALCMGIISGCTCSGSVKPAPTAAPTQKATAAPTQQATAPAPSLTPEESLAPSADPSMSPGVSMSPDASVSPGTGN